MSSPAIRVCLVSPLPPPQGGIGRWSTQLLRWADGDAGVAIEHVDTAPRWRAVDDAPAWKRVVGGGLQMVRDLLRLARRLRRHRFDAIHLTTSGGYAVVRDHAVLALAGLFGVPLFYHLHFGRLPEIARANGLEWRLTARAMRRAKAVVAIDEATRRSIAECLPGVPVAVVPNGIETAGLPEAGRSEPGLRTVLYAGWVIPAKGMAELLGAWSEADPAGWELQVVGPGDERYRRSLLERFRPGRVSFTGALSHEETMARIAACDLFVLPSRTEGFPFVLLEAMALGKPVLATAVGAIPEMLEGGCGVIVEPGNSGALRAALEALAGDAAMREALGLRAREKVRAEYTVESSFGRLRSLWIGGTRC